MNNKENNKNRGMLDASRSGIGGQYQNYVNAAGGRLQQDTNNADSLYSQIRNSYSDNNNFMPQGMSPNSKGWFDLPSEGTGGFGAAGGDYGAAKAGYGKFAETGGINRGDFDPALDSYKDFIKTGGIGESQAQALRARGTAGIPAFYGAYKNALSRRSNVQGGYSPGFDSQMAEIGKQAGREGFNASRQIEGDIIDKQLQGRQFGTSGFGNLMGNITGMEQSGKLAGLGGLKGIGDSEQSNSQFNAGLSESRAGRNQQMQQFLMDMYSSGGKTNASGLSALRSSSDGTLNNSNNNLLAGLGGMSANELQNLAMRLGIKDRSWMDLIPGLVGAGGAVMSGFGGLGAQPFGPKG